MQIKTARKANKDTKVPTPGQQSINTQGNTMSRQVDIEVKVNGKNVLASQKQTKQRTDIQRAKKTPVIAEYFNHNGNIATVEKFKTEKEALNKLTHPDFIGCTVITYKASVAKKQKIQLENA